AAEEYFKLMQATMPTGMGAKQFFTLASSGMYLMRGELDTAQRAAAEAVDYFNETGWGLGAAMSYNAVALFAVLKQDYAAARQAIASTLEIAKPYNSSWMEFQSNILLALCYLREGNKADASDHLRAAMLLGREKGFRNYQLWWSPDLMAEIFSFALEQDIESAYVTEFINRRKLVAPSNAGSRWPWPLRITTLGGFCIFKNGDPIKFERKAQKRILEVIKAIAAAGGRGVSLDKLSTQLWEDADGDRAHNHCYVALHRARNLLEMDQALIVSEGKVSFNSSLIWFDVWELNRLASDLEKQAPEAHALAALVQQLSSLYQGTFLEGDSNEQWVLEQREKLANRFYRAVNQLGEYCEKLNQDALAMRLYNSALDQLAPPESLYLRLMQCHQRAGHYAEALTVYERFERRAAATKLAPSAKIKALREQLEKQVRG
ncbi:MAG TPA: BTAD domain-containing putative transcriptional regulator, partial [Pseudomonadales bacterium]|nr:BTAD domain-containing putative transcriptional regulator [Pseudomonadales bacterium]